MIRLWSWPAPLEWPRANCSTPRTRSPSRRLSQDAAPEPIAPRPTTIASHSLRTAGSYPRRWRRVRPSRGIDLEARVLARLHQLDPTADLDAAVRLRPDEDLGSDTLADREVAPQVAAHRHRRRARRLVLDDPVVRREVARPEDAGLLVDPGPDVDASLAQPRTRERLDIGDGGEPPALVVVGPFGARPDPCPLRVVPACHLAGRRVERGDRPAALPQEPGRPDGGVPGERQLRGGREDPHCARVPVVDEDGLGEAEPRRDRLPPLRGDRAAVEEDAERVAASAVLPDEDPEHVERGHR